MSTSNVIDLELDDLPPPRYGSSSPTGQSRVRYSEQLGSYAPPQNPTTQIVAEILQACTQGDLYKVTHYGSTYDLNVGDYDRRCPIHLASAEGQTLIVKFLISKGVNVNCEDRFGNTPLREALRGNHAEVAKMLRDAGAKMGQASAEIDGEVMRCAAANDVEKLRQLLDAGASANCKDYDGRTPLHIAVAEGHAQCVELLLSKGADCNAPDRWQNTPLSEAMRSGIRVGKDDITELLMRNGAIVMTKEGEQISKHFFWLLIPAQVILIILFGVFVQYGKGPSPLLPNSVMYKAPTVAGSMEKANEAHASFYSKYPFYQDIHVMIFIGFGYLMSFLRKFGYSAVGYTFLMGAFVMQWHILNEGFWHRVFEGKFDSYIEIDIGWFMRTDFCAGAVLISFGALLGKASPTQMLFIMVFEVIFYNINEQIGYLLKISDVGGTYVIHMFGAYFGLGCSWILSPRSARGRSDNAAVYHSDLFALIGTIFLWMYWPSFNAGPQAGSNPAAAQRAVINTLLGLSGSCLSSFAWTKYYRVEQKFSMVDIQNASIAGGVALGAIADLLAYPVGAIILGTVAGWLSVFGFTQVTPKLEKYLGLHDTCGIHNLHGMPAILGAMAACIIAALAKVENYGSELSIYAARDSSKYSNPRTAEYQAQLQVAFLFITLGVSSVSGLFVGWFATYEFFDPMHDGHLFLDEESWEVPHLETPYYFDRRGEIGRQSGAAAAPAQEHAGQSVAVNVAPRSASPQRTQPDSMERIAAVLSSLQQEISSARKRN